MLGERGQTWNRHFDGFYRQMCPSSRESGEGRSVRLP
jgi:hypothetical protein